MVCSDARLVSQKHRERRQTRRNLAYAGEPKSKRRSHSALPLFVQDHLDDLPGQCRPDLGRMGAQHDYQRFEPRETRLLNGVLEQGSPFEFQQLFCAAHAGGGAGGQDERSRSQTLSLFTRCIFVIVALFEGTRVIASSLDSSRRAIWAQVLVPSSFK